MTNLQVKDRFEFPLALDMTQYTLEGAGAAMVSRDVVVCSHQSTGRSW